MQVDLTSESAVKKLFELYKGSLIQVLIANHAIWPSKYESVAEMPLERWNKTISINLTSTFLVVCEFLQHLGRDGVSASVLDKAASVLRKWAWEDWHGWACGLLFNKERYVITWVTNTSL